MGRWISANIGIKVPHLDDGWHHTHGGTLAQSPGSLAGDVTQRACQELFTEPRGSEKRQEVCERNSKEVS